MSSGRGPNECRHEGVTHTVGSENWAPVYLSGGAAIWCDHFCRRTKRNAPSSVVYKPQLCRSSFPRPALNAVLPFLGFRPSFLPTVLPFEAFRSSSLSFSRLETSVPASATSSYSVTSQQARCTSTSPTSSPRLPRSPTLVSAWLHPFPSAPSGTAQARTTAQALPPGMALTLVQAQAPTPLRAPTPRALHLLLALIGLFTVMLGFLARTARPTFLTSR